MKIHYHEPRESRSTTRTQAVVRKLQRGVLLIRVLALCVNSVAYAQPAAPVKSMVTPEQAFMPGYLEAVSTGYDNGQALYESEGMATVRLPRPVANQLRPSPMPVMPVSVPMGPSAVPASSKGRKTPAE
jgi:hypothetical protein